MIGIYTTNELIKPTSACDMRQNFACYRRIRISQNSRDSDSVSVAFIHIIFVTIVGGIFIIHSFCWTNFFQYLAGQTQDKYANGTIVDLKTNCSLNIFVTLLSNHLYLLTNEINRNLKCRLYFFIEAEKYNIKIYRI